MWGVYHVSRGQFHTKCTKSRFLMNQLAKTTRSTPLAQKIDEAGLKRLQLVIGKTLLLRIEAWKRLQPLDDPMNTSEAIRRLVEMSLDAEWIAPSADKPKPKRKG